MDLRRFAIAAMIVASGLALLVLYTQMPSDSGEASEVPATQPADTQPAATPPGEPPRPEVQPADEATEVSAADDRTPPGPDTAPATRAARTRPGEESDPPPTTRWMQIHGPQGEPVLLGSLDPRTGYTMRLEVHRLGAALNTVKLSNYFATVEDKRLFDEKPDEYPEIVAAEPEKYGGHYSLLNPVQFQDTTYYPLATRSVSVRIGEEAAVRFRLDTIPWRLVDGVEQIEGGQRVRLAYSLRRADTDGRPRDVITLYKTYTLEKGTYSIGVSLEAETHWPEPIELELDQYGPVGIPLEDVRRDSRKLAYARLGEDGQSVQVRLVDRGQLQKAPLGETQDIGSTQATEPVLWVGEINKFFGSMLYLLPRREDRIHAVSYPASYYSGPIRESAGSETFLTGVRTATLTLRPGGSTALNFDLFAGPKRRDMFVNTKDEYYRPLYGRLEYIGTIDFGGCSFCTITWLSLAMMWLLEKLSYVALGNYGVAIFLLVFLVRICLHPLTKRSQVSMMKMQKLGPQMKALEEKYKDDKEALNREKVRLFKEGGATPLLGCLPMLVQMPLWVALWTSINASVQLRHAAFLPVWITDLAAPDALFSWPPVTIPILGVVIDSFNLLPILLAIAMFLQTRLNPQMTGQAAASPEAQKQQQMMRFFFPAMMLVLFYKAPSGLTLYIMASTFIGVTEQYVIRKHIRDREALEAAQETRVQVPGRRPRSSRPKKPKGPNWFKQG